MSLYDYRRSQELELADEPVAALVMAAMRRGDDFHVARLKTAFPHYWQELKARYDAPAGLLPGEANDAYVRREDGVVVAAVSGDVVAAQYPPVRPEDVPVEDPSDA